MGKLLIVFLWNGGILLIFLFIFLLIILAILSLKIKIKIKKMHFSSIHKKRHFNKDYKFVIQLRIFGFLPIFQFKITKNRLEKFKVKEKVVTLEQKVLMESPKFDINLLEVIKKLKLKINELNLKIEIGSGNASITAFIVPIIATLLSFLLRRSLENSNKNFYIITPLFINQNVINVQLSGIFEIKLIHIINIIYILNKKKGVKDYERASNRRSYDYGYE